MFAEKVADSRRNHIDYGGINSANICAFFCEHRREPFSFQSSNNEIADLLSYLCNTIEI
jgi:hypothetical protein